MECHLAVGGQSFGQSISNHVQMTERKGGVGVDGGTGVAKRPRQAQQGVRFPLPPFPLPLT